MGRREVGRQWAIVIPRANEPAAPNVRLWMPREPCHQPSPSHYSSELAMATGMVIETVLTVGVILSPTANVTLWAFRPRSYRVSRGARRVTGIITITWVIVLPVGGALLLGLSADALATGQPDALQDILMGAVAMACWPVVVLALRKRRANYRSL